MKILITGGTGFIGLNIAEKMLEAGNEVILYAQTPLTKSLSNYLFSFTRKKGLFTT